MFLVFVIAGNSHHDHECEQKIKRKMFHVCEWIAVASVATESYVVRLFK